MMLQVLLLLTFCALLGFSQVELEQAFQHPPEDDTLQCHRKKYVYRVTQTDVNGKQCWDTLETMACWGRCDSKEISDWRFPYKKSSHPVCVHYGRNRAIATLRHCEEDVVPGTENYEYMEAHECKCQVCSSYDTSCEGVRFRPHRSDKLGFLS